MGTYYNNNGTLVPIAGRGSGVNRNDVAYVETGTTASRNYSVGQLVYVSGAMYRVKSAIQSGQTFTVGTNIEATTIGGEIQRINNDLSVTYENIDAGQSSGTIQLVRYGKNRELVFQNVGLPSGQTPFNFPTLAEKDRPIVLFESALIMGGAVGWYLIWVRVNGTFGQGGSSVSALINGQLSWIVP